MKVLKKKSRGENKERKKVVVVLGPTASEKSELGVQLALMFQGEVVSADSRQVYRALNISSSKVPGKWKRIGRRRFFIYKGVPHHLIDLISPRKQFNVQQYKKKAERAIGQILGRGYLPIIVGGTGFYIDSLVHSRDIPKAPPQKKLRKELEKLSTEQLINRLKGLDPHRAETIDTKNKRRLVRAVEIVVLTGSQVPHLELADKSYSPYNLLKIGIKPINEDLKERMSQIIDKRIEDGVINEIKRLHRRGMGWKRFEELGMEFHHISEHIKGNITIDELKKLIHQEYWQYAKRQMTWFKRDKNIIWIDVPEKAFPIVQDFLGREGEPSPAQSKT